MPVTSERSVPVVALLVLLLGAACGGGDPSSRSPTAPSSTGGAGAAATGPWTGTLTRPDGLGTLSLTWEARTESNTFIGPLTLTNGAANVTVTARGVTSGNDRQGYGIFVSFNQEANEAPTTGCRIIGATVGEVRFTSPFTRITVPAFDVSYSGCRGGLITSGFANPQSDFLRETVRLDLSK